jgi:hypothetical protein
MFFKKGLRDLSLIRKFTMKNLRTPKEMPPITNKYVLAKEVTLDNKDTKKDNEPSLSDRPSTSKNNDKNRKPDRSVTNIERPRYKMTEYQPQPVEFEGFLDRICIFHLQEKHKTRDCD